MKDNEKLVEVLGKLSGQLEELSEIIDPSVTVYRTVDKGSKAAEALAWFAAGTGDLGSAGAGGLGGVAMTDNDALNQTRDALHIAFTLIANARNSLDNNVSNRDPVLADQWHEAAARFMQDYNANLDVYTGRSEGFTAIQTVGDAPGCPACDGVAGTECRCHLRTGCDLGTTRCHRAEAAEAAIERVRKLCDDFEHEENLNGGIGRYAVVRVDRVRSALNGDSDE